VKSIDIVLDIWKWSGIVFVGGKSADFAAWCKKNLDIEIETGSNAAGHAHVSYGKPWVIWIESLNEVACLAHEALHVTTGILEARGLKYSEASEEAYTYTMEFIISHALTTKGYRKVKP
jgi:hypothetical protein